MTVLGDDILYLHVIKSAGTWTTNRLLHHGLGKQVDVDGIRPHIPLALIPPEWFVGRVVLFTVRNPWDWYVSYIHYHLLPDGTPRGELARLVAKDGIDGPGWHMAPILRCIAGLYTRKLAEQIPVFANAVDVADIRTGLSRLLGFTVAPMEPLCVAGHDGTCSPHKAPEEYYRDPELWSLVQRRDLAVIDRFGYTGPGTSAVRGCV